MPQTVPDGFEYEALADGNQGRTLHGGQHGDSEILAQQVQQKFLSVEQTVADLSDSLATRPGWHTIYSNDVSGDISISVPAGVYDTIRCHLRGSLTGLSILTVRVNNDTTASLHRRGRINTGMHDGAVNAAESDDGDEWFLATWGTSPNNVADFTIYRTNINTRVSMIGTGSRNAGSTTLRERSEVQGELDDARLLSSLRFKALNGSGESISEAYIVVEGHRPMP